MKQECYSCVNIEKPSTWFPSTDAEAECQLPHDDSCNLKLFQHGTLANLNPLYHEGIMFSSGGVVQWYSPLNVSNVVMVFAKNTLYYTAACLHKVVNIVITFSHIAVDLR